MSDKIICCTCGHLRETAGTTTKYFVPPVNEETKPGLNAEEKQECWQFIEKACKPYGGFVNVITNCGGSLVSMVWINSMNEYAAQQTTALQQENQRLRDELNQCRNFIRSEHLTAKFDSFFTKPTTKNK